MESNGFRVHSIEAHDWGETECSEDVPSAKSCDVMVEKLLYICSSDTPENELRLEPNLRCHVASNIRLYTVGIN